MISTNFHILFSFDFSETIFQQGAHRFNRFGRTNGTILLFRWWWPTAPNTMAKRWWKYARWKVNLNSKKFNSIKISTFQTEILLNRAVIKDDDKSLIIKNVIPADEGIYICDAHNGVGQISAKAQLVVNCKYHKLRDNSSY